VAGKTDSDRLRLFEDGYTDSQFNLAFDSGETTTERHHYPVSAINEITSHVEDGGTPKDFTHDAAGNLLDADELHTGKDYTYIYEAWNRIVEVQDDQQATVATYAYDALAVRWKSRGTGFQAVFARARGPCHYRAGSFFNRRLGRRISKTVGTDTEYFYYDGNRVIETHRDTGAGPALESQYVYGLDYIDEPVAKYDATGLTHFIHQDANYNVVALTDATGALAEQYAYHPYGEYLAKETGSGADLGATPPTVPFGHQGLWFNEETGIYHNRHRDYIPPLGRFMQRDPNETALVLEAVARDNAENASIFAALMPRGQYRDGMSLYLYLASNPSITQDPLGLYRDFDWWAEFDDQESEWIGQRLYALGTINEGARWAALGLQTTLDIAGALLGVDVFESVSVLASGGGGFWEAMDVFMAVAPFGRFVKVAGKIGDAAKIARRAKGAMIAVDKARDLTKVAKCVDRNSRSFKKAVSKAKKQYPKLAGKGSHNHHILPRYLGGPPDGPTVPLNPAYHQWITNEFRTQWRYGQKPPELQELRKIMKKVYDKYPIPKN
jgi:RHS repeat-associated protein